MSNEDIRSLAGSIASEVRRLGREQRLIESRKHEIIRNNKSIVWSVTGLPENIIIPDLAMKINPTNLSENFQKLINRKRTKGGFIVEHWGDQLDSISATGVTGGFMNERGLTNENRRDTSAFQSFESLISIYRNNGSIYSTRDGSLVAQGSIIMYYDDTIRHGFFETFSVDESPEKPYNIDYQFTFKIMYDQFPGRKVSFRNVNPVGLSDTNQGQNSSGILDSITFDIVGE